MYTTYEILNKISSKTYSGWTKDIETRFKKHKSELRGGYHHCKHLQRAWNKYGESVFEFKILNTFTTSGEAINEEIKLIAYYKSINLSYNMTNGGEGISGYKHTKESLEKISIGNTSKIVTEDQRQRMLGREVSEQTREKLRQANLGKVVSDETKKKLSESHLNKEQSTLQKAASDKRKGVPLPKEKQEKLYKFPKGNIPWNKGKPWSEERRKMLEKKNKNESI